MDYVIDIETDGINASKIHCMSVSRPDDWMATFVTYDDMTRFISKLTKDDRIIGHNFIRYDAPVIEDILGVEIKAQIIDSLALSWYLFPEYTRHGLANWGQRLGIAKPEVDDWENADLWVYVDRCEQDVKINEKLWLSEKKYLEKLYGGDYQHLINYLTHKMNCAMLQESSKWKLDVDKAKALFDNLNSEYDKSYQRLFEHMPKVPVTAKRKRPAKPYKQDGSLSVTGEKWRELCEEHGLDFDHDQDIEVITGYKDPNPTSMLQIKSWLKDLGWKPDAYDYNASGKKIPLVKLKDGTLSMSVQLMVEKFPYLEELATMTVVKSRISVVKNLLKDCDEDGYVKAQVHGFTNTLRFRHAVCVNIPSARKPYGKEIRELFTSRDGSVLCGSDMSSLEDRTKQHFMWQFDPDYVKEMQVEGFDPHLDLALSAGAVTQEQVDAYKDGTDTSISSIRHNYKGGNYACTYGCGVSTLARQLGIKESEADKIHKAYWKRNWSIKSISKSVRVKGNWLLNPINNIWYSLRSEKDIFSTLNQGTGVYCFDLWIGFILKQRPQLTAQFHDEIILEIEEGQEKEAEDLLKSCINKVNNLLKLNRNLDCDVQFGKTYCAIH